MKFLDVPQSGSIAGTTHSHNRAGQYTRNRRSPVQPVGTGRRAFIRSAFGSTSSGWSVLSAADQAAWITYADGHPITDRLGQSIKLTGHQMYVACSTQLLNCGQATIATPPPSSSVSSPVITAFTAVGATGVVTITLDGSGSPDDFFCIAFARPQGSGRTFVNAYWQSTVVPGDNAGGATFGARVVAQFGVLPVGGRLFLRITPANAFGVTGVPVKQFCTIS